MEYSSLFGYYVCFGWSLREFWLLSLEFRCLLREFRPLSREFSTCRASFRDCCASFGRYRASWDAVARVLPVVARVSVPLARVLPVVARVSVPLARVPPVVARVFDLLREFRLLSREFSTCRASSPCCRASLHPHFISRLITIGYNLCSTCWIRSFNVSAVSSLKTSTDSCAIIGPVSIPSSI